VTVRKASPDLRAKMSQASQGHDPHGRFRERGQLALEHYQRTGLSVSAGEVLAKLQANLDAKRKKLRE
jgi:hypothetical protein